MLPVEFKDVVIVGQARAEAPEILSSGEIEDRLAPVYERLRLPRGLLASLTGINERRLYPPGFKPSQGAAAAAENLFAKLGFDRERLDLLYSVSVGRDGLEPSTASIIQKRLGLGGRVKSLDIGSACLGFIDGLELAALALERGLADHALVAAGENSRPPLEATLKRLGRPEIDRAAFFRHFATLTLGSGAAAMILGRSRDYPDAPRLVRAVSLSDAQANDLCRGDAEGMETDSPALLTAGVALGQATFELGASAWGWTAEGFDLFVSHQVSEANTRSLCRTLGLDEAAFIKIYPGYGNIGPAAIPFALDLALERGLIPRRSRLLLMGIGSGLACSMLEVFW